MCLAEMTFNSGYGIKLNKPKNLSNLMEYYFSEDQGRYLIEIELENLKNVNNILNENNVFNEIVGTVQKNYFEMSGEFKINTNDLYETNNTWYNNL
mgnify:CR=1 FL=1